MHQANPDITANPSHRFQNSFAQQPVANLARIDLRCSMEKGIPVGESK
jgi:hypothetical protein